VFLGIGPLSLIEIHPLLQRPQLPGERGIFDHRVGRGVGSPSPA
jgi:hypothetical protein